MSDVLPFASPSVDYVRRYLERKFRLVFYATKTKFPTEQDWNTKSPTLDDYKPGQNIGIILGNEIDTGKFLTDVDLDWGPGISLSKGILPNAGFGFGHSPTSPLSHVFYTTPEQVEYKKYNNIVYNKEDKTERIARSGQCFIEIRGGLTSEGKLGQQTMAPPSIWVPLKDGKPDLSHPGEKLEFFKTCTIESEIPHVDNLPRCAVLYAITCLLHANIVYGTFKHDMRMACAGFLLGDCELTTDETLHMMEAIEKEDGTHDQGDVKTVIKTTLDKIRRNIPYKRIGDFIKILDRGSADYRYGGLIVSQITEWLGGSSFILGAKGLVIANSQENVKRGLERIGMSLSYDIFAQKPLVDNTSLNNGNGYRGPLIDAIVGQAWLEIDEKYHFRADRSFFNTVVDNIAYKNKFHPVLDYLKTLEWDGVSRVDEWLIKSGGAANTEYVRAVSAIMLLAAVKRVAQPGCKYDEMVVLESATQGLLKSTALRTLCPNEKWFSDDLPLNVDAKQIVERTLGKWIIEASDLANMSKANTEHLKGMLSRQTDGPVRLAYGRIPVEQPRQFIIVGTTNSYNYLRDSTGNRRFWPIRVKQFDIQWIRENRDQIWAEVSVREGKGESIRLDPKLYEHAAMQQERRRAEDPWENTLEEAYPRDQEWRLMPDDVWATIGMHDVAKRDPASQKRLLDIMELLGFERNKSIYIKGKGNTKGFRRRLEVGQETLGLKEDEKDD